MRPRFYQPEDEEEPEDEGGQNPEVPFRTVPPGRRESPEHRPQRKGGGLAALRAAAGNRMPKNLRTWGLVGVAIAILVAGIFVFRAMREKGLAPEPSYSVIDPTAQFETAVAQYVEGAGVATPIPQGQIESVQATQGVSGEGGLKLQSEAAPRPTVDVSFLTIVWLVMIVVLFLEPVAQENPLLVVIQGLTPISTAVTLSLRDVLPHDAWVGAVAICLFAQAIALLTRAFMEEEVKLIDLTVIGGTCVLLILQNNGAIGVLGYPDYIPVWVFWAIGFPALLREAVRNPILSVVALVLGVVAGYLLTPWFIMGAPLLLILIMMGAPRIGWIPETQHKTQHSVNMFGRILGIILPWDSFIVYLIAFAGTAVAMRGADWVVLHTIGG